ncbi:hypothetical protein [Bradyrhizobium sp. UNPF46]|uniref:hypothetical protein n=1 Tax=Bradyrhizobium sp. UNPF46 TaxID=1141168 RepID=UPI00114FD235|nr:hypothetical protein [Bradyrhizobium sp. UNPF46]
MGDNFSNISQSVIYNRSLVKDSSAMLSTAGNAAAAEAITKVAKLVEESGNKEAEELFAQFNEELQKPEPRKSLLRRSWDSLVAVLPAVTAVAGAAAAISKLFS